MSLSQTPLSTRRQCSWTLYFIYFNLLNTNINKSAGFLTLSANTFPLSNGLLMIPILQSIRNLKSMNFLWLPTSARTGLTKNSSPYYEKRYGKQIRPVSRRSECDIPDDCSCLLCDAPKPFLYRNNGSKGQLLCKICAAGFSPSESRFSSMKLRYPYCGNALIPKKDRKHFTVHKCVNPKCPYYLHNLKKVDMNDLKEDYGKNKYKLYYIYREFTMDFFSMDLNNLPKNASSLKFSKHNAHVMSLCLTFHINLAPAMRIAFQGLTKLPKNFKFIADGYSAYPLAAMEFIKKLGKDFTFKITQVIGLTNGDAVSTQHRPFKQMIEHLNRTYKASYRRTNTINTKSSTKWKCCGAPTICRANGSSSFSLASRPS